MVIQSPPPKNGPAPGGAPEGQNGPPLLPDRRRERILAPGGRPAGARAAPGRVLGGFGPFWAVFLLGFCNGRQRDGAGGVRKSAHLKVTPFISRNDQKKWSPGGRPKVAFWALFRPFSGTFLAPVGE